MLASIRSDPGNVSLNTMLAEIAQLESVRSIGLSAGVFADPAVAHSSFVSDRVGLISMLKVSSVSTTWCWG